MRKTSYAVTFLVVAVILVLDILSLSVSPDWLIVKYPKLLGTRVTEYYGLTRLCTHSVTHIPGPTDGGDIQYSSYTCRAFPLRDTDRCDKENSYFCTAWSSAGYSIEMAIGFAAVSLLALIIGVSTHSRRRRIWRMVAGLIAIQTVFQIAAFAIVTDLYRTGRYAPFERARPSTAYILNTLSWVIGVLTVFGVVVTGRSADKGHRWAAGNRDMSRNSETSPLLR